MFQKAIASQNPSMSRQQRVELRTNKGHDMTFQRYHRYSGTCSCTLLLLSLQQQKVMSAKCYVPDSVLLADMLRYMNYLSLKYPELVELLIIGKSSKGQPLKVIKISTGQRTKDGNIKPAVWIDGG